MGTLLGQAAQEAAGLMVRVGEFIVLFSVIVRLCPLPERNVEFMFYFDLEAPVYEPRFLQLMGELDELSENCFYLGSYSEVI